MRRGQAAPGHSPRLPPAIPQSISVPSLTTSLVKCPHCASVRRVGVLAQGGRADRLPSLPEGFLLAPRPPGAPRRRLIAPAADRPRPPRSPSKPPSSSCSVRSLWSIPPSLLSRRPWCRTPAPRSGMGRALCCHEGAPPTQMAGIAAAFKGRHHVAVALPYSANADAVARRSGAGHHVAVARGGRPSFALPRGLRPLHPVPVNGDAAERECRPVPPSMTPMPSGTDRPLQPSTCFPGRGHFRPVYEAYDRDAQRVVALSRQARADGRGERGRASAARRARRRTEHPTSSRVFYSAARASSITSAWLALQFPASPGRRLEAPATATSPLGRHGAIQPRMGQSAEFAEAVETRPRRAVEHDPFARGGGDHPKRPRALAYAPNGVVPSRLEAANVHAREDGGRC